MQSAVLLLRLMHCDRQVTRLITKGLVRHRIAISDILDWGSFRSLLYLFFLSLTPHKSLPVPHDRTSARAACHSGFRAFCEISGINVFCVAMSTGGGVGGQGEVHGNPTIGVMVTVVCLVTCSAACLLLALSSTTVDAQTYHYRYVTDKTSALAILSYWINY